MRTFIAVDLPAEIKERIAGIQAELETCGCAAKWVKPDNTHLTLKFFGEVGQEKISEIKRIMAETAARRPPLTINLGAFGFFPNERRPRVFFIGTSSREILKNLADDLERNLQALGFKPEGRFQSHITLARFKQTKNIEHLLKKIEKIHLDEPFNIAEITLYKSTLAASGPVYEVIAKSPLTA